jgi:hypothetical protein
MQQALVAPGRANWAGSVWPMAIAACLVLWSPEAHAVSPSGRWASAVPSLPDAAKPRNRGKERVLLRQRREWLHAVAKLREGPPSPSRFARTSKSLATRSAPASRPRLSPQRSEP